MSADLLNLDDYEAVKAVGDEARSGFELKSRLQGLNRRTKEVTVYTDEVLGEKYETAKREITQMKELIRPVEGVNLTTEVIAQAQAEIDKWQPVVDETKVELEKTAMVFSLRAVPPIVSKIIARDVRKALGIKGAVPDDLAEEWNTLFNAHLLSKQTVSYTDVESDTTTSLSVDDARDLEYFLPPHQYEKLRTAWNDLQLRDTLGEVAVDSADFSQAG